MKVAELNLVEHWTIYLNRYNATRPGFLAYLAPLVSNPGALGAEIKWCEHCGLPGHADGGFQQIEGRNVCNDCVGRYWRECVMCHQKTTTYTDLPAAGGMVCNVCLEENFFYCRQHRGWYPANEARLHRHGAAGCCVSPEMEFTFPNQGQRLAQDTRVTVDMEGGVLPTRGLDQVISYLRNQALLMGNVRDPDSRAAKLYRFAGAFSIGTALTNKDGNYTTRLKKQAYKNYRLKLDPEILTGVGNIVSINSRGSTYHVEVTRDLNGSAAEFGNQGSCWWSDYKGSRCALKTNGGLGLRAFSEPGPGRGRVNGRIWVLPLRKDVDGRLVPTFRTDGDIWFVFNGYGVLAEQAGVQLVALMTGIEDYMTVRFDSDRENGMYINNNQGFLVASRKTMRRIDHLPVALEQHSHLYEQEKEMNHV